MWILGLKGLRIRLTSPSYYKCGPLLLSQENRRKIEPKEIPSCLIPHLLVSLACVSSKPHNLQRVFRSPLQAIQVCAVPKGMVFCRFGKQGMVSALQSCIGYVFQKNWLLLHHLVIRPFPFLRQLSCTCCNSLSRAPFTCWASGLKQGRENHAFWSELG